MNKHSLATILLVDDEASQRLVMKAVLQDSGYDVLEAADGIQALEIAARRAIDLAVLDLMMPRMDGRELMRRLKQRDADLPIVFLTAHGSIPSAVEAIKEGAADYLTKPLPHVSDLVRVIDRILETRRLARENQTLLRQTQDSDPFPAVDPLMLSLLEKARKVAENDVTVLIVGESGTGKERLAKYLHHHSARRNRPMVTINCAAIPENLLESELFGHEKGAFTGAIERRIGCFEEAHLSTLFLDEIGELPLSLQPKLLRALQEREFRRVGGDRVLRSDIRLLAATNRELKDSSGKTPFREDLYYRLSVVTFRLPPLRERPADIRFFAERFVKEFGKKFGKPELNLSESAHQVLLSQNWPGNVRELSNALEASVLLCEGSILEGPDLLNLVEPPPASAVVGEHAPLAAAERRTVLDALARFQGNRKQTAEFLGMTTRNLLYKLKKWNI